MSARRLLAGTALGAVVTLGGVTAPAVALAPATEVAASAQTAVLRAADEPSKAPEVLTVPAPPDSADRAPVERPAEDAPLDEDAAASDDGGFPWFGSLFLGACVLVAAAWVLRTRIRS